MVNAGHVLTASPSSFLGVKFASCIRNRQSFISETIFFKGPLDHDEGLFLLGFFPQIRLFSVQVLILPTCGNPREPFPIRQPPIIQTGTSERLKFEDLSTRQGFSKFLHFVAGAEFRGMPACSCKRAARLGDYHVEILQNSD